MSETIILDPSEVALSRTELDISDFIRADGIDWDDAAIQQYQAEQARGQLAVDFRYPNRNVQIPLRLKTVGSTTFDTIREQIQAKAALFQREGGWLKRELSNGNSYFLDVVNATLKLSGGWSQAHGDYDVEATLNLECVPDFYGAERTLSDHAETTNPELIFTETAIDGDYPGRLRIVVDEDQGQDQRGLIYGIRARHYESAATAALSYSGASRTPLDSASVFGAGIIHSDLGVNWTPVLSTQAASAGAHLTHKGSYGVWAELISSDGAAVSARLLWDVGDFSFPVENDAWTFPGASLTYHAYLGEVRLDPTTGTHRWQGVIQAKGTAGSEDIVVGRIWFQPLDEFAGTLRASVNADQGLAPYSARDEFNQAAGNLATKTLAVGGTWTGAGDADDFDVVAGAYAHRKPGGVDVDAHTGRYGIAGTTASTAIVVQADVAVLDRPALAGTTSRRGVLARYTDTSNWLRAAFNSTGVVVEMRVAGTVTTLGSYAFTRVFGGSVGSPALFYSIRLTADASGNWAVFVGAQGGALSQLGAGSDTALATGGALATGKKGIYDAQTVSETDTYYDNFAAWVPSSDAVMFANQSAELRWDGQFREDSTGTAYGPISYKTGDLLRIPPSGLEGRTVQVLVKGSRGDLDQVSPGSTAVADDISARAYYRPSWLFVAG